VELGEQLLNEHLPGNEESDSGVTSSTNSEEQQYENSNQIDAVTQNINENKNAEITSSSVQKSQMLRRMHGKDYRGMKKDQETNKWK